MEDKLQKCKEASLRSALTLIWISFLCSNSIQLTEQLAFSSIQIPSLVQRGSNCWLSCQFELSPDDQLYSVKWYKNNEEFYRLMSAGPESVGQQQQYFAQTGINVLMSQSNATHVRLLNSSLESEGLYACEISTQNLSTIRYEKHIHIYVLPGSRLNIAGYKQRYSLNDRVDLLCSSDSSKPQPALGWFINNQRISGSNQWFELVQSATTAQLKFKLTLNFLKAFLLQQQPERLGQRPAGNQSNFNPSQLKQRQQQFNLRELRLSCILKLTEISDITFNELIVGEHLPGSGSDRKWPVDKQAATSAAAARYTLSSRASAVDYNAEPLQRIRVAKSRIDHRVLQNKLVSFKELLRLSDQIFGLRSANQCSLGLLALTADDPVITIESGATSNGEEGIDEARRRKRQVAWIEPGGPLELSAKVGDLISVNCSTVSSLASIGNCNEQQQPKVHHRAINGGFNLNGEQQRAQQQHIVAHVSLAESDANNLANDNYMSSSADSAKLLDNDGGGSAWSQPPPPLLEWFINNQEAPGIKYSPELPLLTAERANNRAGVELAADYPSIDSAKYFANFDAAWPTKQSLRMDLRLKKEHLLSADSKLHLKCSSTQARLLYRDSVNLILIPMHLTTDQKQTNHWQQRPALSKYQQAKKISRNQMVMGGKQSAIRSPNNSSFRPYLSLFLIALSALAQLRIFQ